MPKLFRHLKKTEKIIVTFLLLVVFLSLFQIGRAFYLEHSDITPVEGGIYTEGMVGKLGIVNPVYVNYGSITHDVTQLIFSGLTKYDPKTGDIVPDLADFEISENKKEYTFNLKENAKWHDGTPVTSNDVLFTYNQVINSPEFKGLVLNYNDYKGIKLIKTNERQVQFLLEEPDAFFLVKTIIGLLPEHLLSPVPVSNLDQAAFNQSPIGTGPYQLTSISSIDDFLEINLEAFDDYYGQKPNIPTIRLKIFDSYDSLIRRQSEMDAIRNIPKEYLDRVLKKGHLSFLRYHLPQYVAVFINTQSEILKNPNVRLGLQLGTDKKSIIDGIGQEEIVDTPFLEIDQKNWVYQYSVNKGNGALFDAGWKIDKPTEAVKPSANDESESGEVVAEETAEVADETPRYITSPNGGKDWKTTDQKVTLTGTAPEKTKSIFVNDYELKKYTPADASWSYIASFEFGNLKGGKNTYEIYAVDFNDEKSLIDSIVIEQGTDDDFSIKDQEKVELENQEATILPIRKNEKGEDLILKMVIPKQPADYELVANLLKEQWRKIGVQLTIESLESDLFQEAIFKRDYDLLIFGQNLGYNLDAYPYWHSSQAKEGGYNLSQFKSFIVDSFLEKVRLQYSREARQNTLNKAQEVMSKEVPAIFLYRPTYRFGVSDKIQNIKLNNLANTSDHFATIADWYAKVDRRLNKGVNPLTLASWLIKQF